MEGMHHCLLSRIFYQGTVGGKGSSVNTKFTMTWTPLTDTYGLKKTINPLTTIQVILTMILALQLELGPCALLLEQLLLLTSCPNGTEGLVKVQIKKIIVQ